MRPLSGTNELQRGWFTRCVRRNTLNPRFVYVIMLGRTFHAARPDRSPGSSPLSLQPNTHGASQKATFTGYPAVPILTVALFNHNQSIQLHFPWSEQDKGFSSTKDRRDRLEAQKEHRGDRAEYTAPISGLFSSWNRMWPTRIQDSCHLHCLPCPTPQDLDK